MDQQIKIIKNKINERLASDNDDAFYLLDVNDISMKYRKWVEKIPRVTPFYAVKCNNDENVLRNLARSGAGFDCASKLELKMILELNVAPDRIIYAHTVKQISHLKYAAEKRVMRVTFDSPEELKKIKQFHPKAQVVLRIRFDAKNSIINLGVKFGCDPDAEAPILIQMCKDMQMELIGVSFHVGSGTQDYEIFERALATVRRLFDVAIGIGFDLRFVDIGGGFMGNDISLLDHYAESINRGIERYFPDESISIISEPGRYFVESAFTLATQIVLRRTAIDGHVNYYINEGIYMSFLISYIYEEKLCFEIIRQSTTESTTERLSTVWGSSCNSKDKIIDSRMIPELNIGDWLVFRNMGAYTTNVSTSFNGFQIGEVIPINT